MKLQAIIENLVYECKKYRYTRAMAIEACEQIAYIYGLNEQEAINVRYTVLNEVF